MPKPIDPYEALRAIQRLLPSASAYGSNWEIQVAVRDALANIPPKYAHVDELIEAADAMLAASFFHDEKACQKALSRIGAVLNKCKDDTYYHTPKETP